VSTANATDSGFDSREADLDQRSEGNTIYVGSANGGVWKTTNGGMPWL
jgi:hypothetical protein